VPYNGVNKESLTATA